jgi:NADH-quinone oxidoreductase subunit C
VTPSETAVALEDRFPKGILEVVEFRGQVTVLVSKSSLIDVVTSCRDDYSYNFLSDITAVDWPGRSPRFDVVYQLTSLKHWSRLRLKVQMNEGERVPSTIPVWPAANWAEREVWDLFGIEFEGHPNLSRLLMPEGWIGHPLRKDFPQTQIVLPRPKSDKTGSEREP